MDKQAKEPDLFNQVLAIAMKEGKLQFSKDADPSQSGVVGENYLLFSRQRKLLISIPLENLKRNTRNMKTPRKVKVHNVFAYLIACVVGFLVLGLGGMILAPTCLFLINKVFISINKKPFSFLRWFIWFLFGVWASLIHLANNPTDLCIGPYCGEIYSVSSQSIAAKNTIATIAKECAMKEADGRINPTFEVPNLRHYLISPSDGSCRGDEFGVFRAIRKDNKDKAEFDFWSPNFSGPTPIPTSPSIPKEIRYNPKTGAKTCIAGDDEAYCKEGRW